jgi:hypothetical protein
MLLWQMIITGHRSTEYYMHIYQNITELPATCSPSPTPKENKKTTTSTAVFCAKDQQHKPFNNEEAKIEPANTYHHPTN